MRGVKTLAAAGSLLGSLLVGTGPGLSQDAVPEKASVTVPAEHLGFWAEGSCAEPGVMQVIGSGGVLVLSPERTALVPYGEKESVDGGWFRNTERPAGGRTTWQRLVEGNLEIYATTGPAAAPPEPTAGGTADWDKMVLGACDGVPEGAPAFLKEAMGVYQALDKVAAGCGANVQSCVQSAFDTVDATRDGRLSRAEVSRLVRGLRFLAMARDGVDRSVSGRGAVDVALESMVGAVPVAATLVSLYDYDADGVLTMRDITRDFGVGGLGRVIGKFGPATIGDAVDFLDMLDDDSED